MSIYKRILSACHESGDLAIAVNRYMELTAAELRFGPGRHRQKEAIAGFAFLLVGGCTAIDSLPPLQRLFLTPNYGARQMVTGSPSDLEPARLADIGAHLSMCGAESVIRTAPHFGKVKDRDLLLRFMDGAGAFFFGSDIWTPNDRPHSAHNIGAALDAFASSYGPPAKRKTRSDTSNLERQLEELSAGMLAHPQHATW